MAPPGRYGYHLEWGRDWVLTAWQIWLSLRVGQGLGSYRLHVRVSTLQNGDTQVNCSDDHVIEGT